MARYIISSPHTKEECLAVLDETLAQGPQVLAMWDYGCAAGEHTAYTTVEAASLDDARRQVPEIVRQKAHVVELNKFTPEQIRSYHQM